VCQGVLQTKGATMNREPRIRPSIVGLIGLLVLAAILLSACGNKSATDSTAMDNYPAARSAALKAAPDARLLLVQTFEATTPTSAPVWYYLFGSPSAMTAYAVVASQGRLMSTEQVAGEGFPSSEWSAVPSADAWKIDSDAAYAKAFEVDGAGRRPRPYTMGFETYKPSTDTSTVEPFTWRVTLFPGTNTEATGTVDVSATTGNARVVVKR
jgi:hypothetical protein